LSRECAQHRSQKSNYGWMDWLGELTPAQKRQYKRVVRRGRRVTGKREIEAAWRAMDTSTCEFKDEGCP
jgi:hypothetical protein